jgi:A/G-specific adenine glycosylase
MTTPQSAAEMTEIIHEKGRQLYRQMPWRQDTRPYYVLVSELMLQQTQVERVIPKFLAFVQAFPDEQALASASLADVLVLWQGLGYNRRAKFLHDAAKQIVARGGFPDDLAGLLELPGVGKNTAGAILAYSYNQPALFVETNVRTVYFHHFFTNGDTVDDKQVLDMLAQTIDREHPREFYWALMDYGSWLKRQGAGRIQQSRHYKKQSPLKGSVREVRGQIIRLLAVRDLDEAQLQTQLPQDERFMPALEGLVQDGLVSRRDNGVLHLTK